MSRSLLRNRMYLLFFGLISIVNLKAQDIDSIRLAISALSGSADKLLAYKSHLDQNKSVNPEGYLLLAREAIELAQKTGDDQLLCKFYYDLSSCYYFLYEIDSMIVYAEKSADLAEYIEDFKLSSTSNNLLGIAYKSKAAYTTALEHFISSIQYAEAGGDSILAGTALINMAQLYDVMNDTTATVETYKKAIGTFSRFKDSLNLAIASQNLGIYIGNKDSSIYFQERALAIFEKINHPIGQGYSLNGLGPRYIEKGQFLKGLDFLERAEKVWESQNFREGLPSVYLNLASAYAKKGLFGRADYYWNKAESLGKEIEDIAFLMEFYESKSHDLKEAGAFEEALYNYEWFNNFKDSLAIIERQKDLAEIEAKYENDKKRSEIEILNKDLRIRDLSLQKSRNCTILLSLGSLLLLGFSTVSYLFYKRAKSAKEKSDELLLNILPAQIAEELKLNGKTTAKSYDKIAVLFTDFEGFSTIAHQQSASEIVHSIDYYFKRFDDITTRYQIEKIKTIGDAYLAVSGLNKDEAFIENIINAAIDMQQVVLEIAVDKHSPVKQPFKMRIGIHVGPLVAGVVGVKKFQYDIWGNTVNIASRLESTGEAGNIAISQETYEAVKHNESFSFEVRDPLGIKNIGIVQSYFVKRRI